MLRVLRPVLVLLAFVVGLGVSANASDRAPQAPVGEAWVEAAQSAERETDHATGGCERRGGPSCELQAIVRGASPAPARYGLIRSFDPVTPPWHERPGPAADPEPPRTA